MESAKHKEVYFPDVPKYGDLYLDAVLLEFEVVDLMTILRNERGDYFFCVCCEIRWEQRWIISPATWDEIRQFLQNKISARAFFVQGEKIEVVKNYKSNAKSYSISLVSAEDIHRDYLPDGDAFLEAETHEWDEYLAKMDVAHMNEWGNHRKTT